MWKLEFKVLLLWVFIVGTFQDQLSSTTKNVCLHSETYNDEIVVKVKKPRTIIKKKMCWKLRKFFQCNYKSKIWEEVNETRLVQRSRIVLKCCSGYKEQAGSCLPICPQGCINGICQAPDSCVCSQGFHGPRCNQGIPTTTNPPESTTSATALEAFTTPYETENGKSTDEAFTFDVLQTTETDLTPQINKETTLLTTEETTSNEIDNEISTDTASTEKEEISTQTTQNAKTTTELLPNLSQSVIHSEKAVVEIKNDNFLQEEVDPENEPSGFEGNLSTAVAQAPVNKNSVLELKAESESTIEKTATSTTNFVDLETIMSKNYLENNRLSSIKFFHLTPGLCLFSVVCLLLVFLAAWWLIIYKRNKFKQVQLEKKQAAFHSEERVKFQAENVFLVCNISEKPILITDLEIPDVKPVLKTFKPSKGDEKFISTGRHICQRPKLEKEMCSTYINH